RNRVAVGSGRRSSPPPAGNSPGDRSAPSTPPWRSKTRRPVARSREVAFGRSVSSPCAGGYVGHPALRSGSVALEREVRDEICVRDDWHVRGADSHPWRHSRPTSWLSLRQRNLRARHRSRSIGAAECPVGVSAPLAPRSVPGLKQVTVAPPGGHSPARRSAIAGY